MAIQIITSFLFFLLGLVIGSFLNVCIYRITQKEDVVLARSHCMSCGHQLKWYELFAVLRYIIQKGRCRRCSVKITIQYLIIELMNGIGYVWIFLVRGYDIQSILYCLLTSVLIVVSFIDAKTMEIPIGCNVFIAILGIIQVCIDMDNWKIYLIGAICVSGFLTILYAITGGRGIGGGDIKLMVSCGLLIGFPRIVLGFFFGCIFAAFIHLLRMKFFHATRVLAFGPYLSIGIWCATLYGQQAIEWYGFVV